MTKNRNPNRSEFPAGHVPDLSADFGGPQPGRRPGSQGTLWNIRQSNAYYRTGDEPGHKGYSPNRLNAVREALPVEHVYTPSAPAKAALGGWREAHPGQMGTMLGEETYPVEAMDIATGITRQNVHDVVARSTAPVEDVRRANSEVKVGDLGTYAGGFSRGRNGERNTISLHGPHLGRRRDNEGADTVIHELGHGVSAENETEPSGWDDPEPIPGVTTNEDPFASPAAAARGEGFADAYMERHSRGPGGAEISRKGLNAYHGYTQGDWNRYVGFADTEGEHAPREYRQSLELHGGRKIPDINADQFRQLRLDTEY